MPVSPITSFTVESVEAIMAFDISAPLPVKIPKIIPNPKIKNHIN